MTAAMAAIGASTDVSSSQSKSPLQAKKEQILARLNSKPPTEHNKPEASKPKVGQQFCLKYVQGFVGEEWLSPSMQTINLTP